MPIRAARSWVVPDAPDSARIFDLQSRFGLPFAVAALLAARLEPGEDAAAFLDPRLDRLADPAGIHDLGRAADVVITAIRSGRRIGIFGDYDLDGISGSALLAQIIERVGGTVDVIIPQRADGYGLTLQAVRAFRRAGASLLITVDNGIAATEAAAEARRCQIELIITDHHRFGPGPLPAAVAHVHPGLGPDPGEWRWASGAGVALALCIEIRRRLRAAGMLSARDLHLGPAIELAALGTIADVVPLRGANRIVVSEGVRRLRRTTSTGLQALFAVAKVQSEKIDEETIAFEIAPRLNACGRVSRARDAYDLLRATDVAEAARLAETADRANRMRREQEARVVSDMDLQLRAGGEPGALVFGAHPDWNFGVLGVAAARLAERLDRPTLLFSIVGDLARGSGRSVPGLDLMRALEYGRSLAVSMGGHAEAAGMTVALRDLARFRAAVEGGLRALGWGDWRRELRIDAEIEIGQWSVDLVESLSRLAPFGSGNPRPLFLSESFVPAEVRVFKGEHVGFRVPVVRAGVDAVGFRLAARMPLPPGPLRIAYRPVVDGFGGRRRVRVLVEDFAAAPI